MAIVGNFPSKAESEQRWEHAVPGGRRVDGQARDGQRARWREPTSQLSVQGGRRQDGQAGDGNE
jgi:hypothetical protein